MSEIKSDTTFYADTIDLTSVIDRLDLDKSKQLTVCLYPHRDDKRFLTKFIIYSAYEQALDEITKLKAENEILKSQLEVKEHGL